MVQRFVVEQLEEFGPAFIREHADVIPHLLQVSLLHDLEMRVEKIPDLFLYLAEQITPFDMALLYIWEPSDMWFCRGIQREIPESLEHGNLFTYTLRKTAKPILIPDAGGLGFGPADGPFPFTSMMGLPIYMDTRTIGCVELYRKEGSPFSIQDLTLIKHLLLYSENALKGALGPEKEVDELLDIKMDIPQRHVLMDILHQYEEQAKRLSYPLSVAIVAIANPERFGQRHGLLGGTLQLKTLAKQIKEGLRCYDRVLRYDESSFFVILPGCAAREAITALSNTLTRLEDELGNSVIIGIATLPDEVQDTKGLMNAAHQALSHARKTGVRIATYSQTGVIKPTNLSLELTLGRILHTGPSLETLEIIADLFRIQCQAEEITLSEEPPGLPVYWGENVLGYVTQRGLSDEIVQWVLAYMAPAWAVAKGVHADIRDWQLGLLTTVSVLADIRAGYAMGYSLKIADQMYTMARVLGRDEAEALRWSTSALAANIGYMGIPTAILTKDEVNPFDQRRIKAHPLIAARMIRDAYLLDLDEDILTYHHEHLDGSGYPRGLKGDDIPAGARALRVVDTFNAMTSPRLHRPQKRHGEACTELTALAGVTLDPDMTMIYMGLIGA